MMQNKKNHLIILFSGVVLALLLAGGWLLWMNQFLYNPFTYPKAYAEVSGLSYDWFKKPCRAEVVIGPVGGGQQICHLPEGEDQNQGARQWVDYACEVVKHGQPYPADQVNRFLTELESEFYSVRVKRADGVNVLHMTFDDQNDVIFVQGSMFVVEPGLRQTLIDHIMSDYAAVE